jgi:glycosyltransferase involved in cell wall biosynthesis
MFLAKSSMFCSTLGPRALILLAIWLLCLPLIWWYARLFPRKSGRILFWTNEGFRVAPSRLRSYGFANAFMKMGVDAHVLSFWDDIVKFRGLPPYSAPMHAHVITLFRAMAASIRGSAGTIVAQRPYYDLLPLLCLKLLYGRKLSVWADVDDWIFDYSFGGGMTFRSVLPCHSLISEGCIASSEPLLRELSNYYGAVEMIPTFPDHNLFKPVSVKPVYRSYVVFSWTGTMFLEMNLTDIIFMIDALESLGDNRVCLQVVGAGYYLESARQEASVRARRLNVEFLGWREPDTMPQYYAGIDVGLYTLTSHDDFSRSKSPTKLFEYMACGKPTVSTDFGEAARFVEHGLTGFLARDKNEFAHYCGRLIEDPELRRRMGDRARWAIERQYNIHQAAIKLRRVFNI